HKEELVLRIHAALINFQLRMRHAQPPGELL
ncbi:uncharacterized protein METZ01_LOCUS297762, partial [marine metagenome]